VNILPAKSDLRQAKFALNKGVQSTLISIQNYKGVIFDLDGTLIDSVGFCWLSALADFLQENGAALTLDDKKEIERTQPHPNEEWGQWLISKYKLMGLTPKQCLQRLQQLVLAKYHCVDYKPTTRAFLQELKNKKIPFSLVTSSSSEIIDILRYKNYNTTCFDSLFGNRIITSDTVKNKKPDPSGYLLALKYLGIKPEECIAFEDNLVGVLASKNAGVDVCVVYDKYSDGNREQLLTLTPFHIGNFGEITEWY